MKRLIAALLAGLTLFALVAAPPAARPTPPPRRIIPRSSTMPAPTRKTKYDMIFTKGEDGKFTAIDGYSAEYEAGQLDDEVRNLMMPLLNLEDDMYTDLAASVSSMMVRSYAVAIVKPAEARPTREERTGSLCDQRAAVHGALSGRSVPDRQAPPSPWPPPARSSWCVPRTTTPCWPTSKRHWQRKTHTNLPHSAASAVSFCPQLCYTVPVIVQFYRSNLYV